MQVEGSNVSSHKLAKSNSAALQRTSARLSVEIAEKESPTPSSRSASPRRGTGLERESPGSLRRIPWNPEKDGGSPPSPPRQSARRGGGNTMALHRAMSIRERSRQSRVEPEVRLTAAPTAPSVVATAPCLTWSGDQVRESLKDCLHMKYGDSFHFVDEVLNNFASHLVEGASLVDLLPTDWQVLTGCFAARLFGAI